MIPNLVRQRGTRFYIIDYPSKEEERDGNGEVGRTCRVLEKGIRDRGGEDKLESRIFNRLKYAMGMKRGNELPWMRSTLMVAMRSLREGHRPSSSPM